MAEDRSRRGRRRCCVLLCLALLVLGIAAVTAGILLQQSAHLQWQGNGTTPHISEIVLGRCFTYTQIIQPELRDKNCKQIWNAFKNSFISKNPCNLTEEDYQPLIELASQTLPCDTVLLWSRMKTLAHQYTEAFPEMFTLEDTLLGYMADDLNWCGSPGNSDMNYQTCPHGRKDCRNNAVYVFWKAVSKKFAEAACGVVHVMLNGTTSKAFDPNSIFASVEAVNLNPQKVHALEAWLMSSTQGYASASCSSDSSISDLRSLMTKNNITFTCQNDYRPARLIQCASQTGYLPCRSV